jgi:hypothetical protein
MTSGERGGSARACESPGIACAPGRSIRTLRLTVHQSRQPAETPDLVAILDRPRPWSEHADAAHCRPSCARGGGSGDRAAKQRDEIAPS